MIIITRMIPLMIAMVVLNNKKRNHTIHNNQIVFLSLSVVSIVVVIVVILRILLVVDASSHLGKMPQYWLWPFKTLATNNIFYGFKTFNF